MLRRHMAFMVDKARHISITGSLPTLSLSSMTSVSDAAYSPYALSKAPLWGRLCDDDDLYKWLYTKRQRMIKTLGTQLHLDCKINETDS